MSPRICKCPPEIQVELLSRQLICFCLLKKIIIISEIERDFKHIFFFNSAFRMKCQISRQPGPEVIKLFSYSTQLSTKFILLINVKMPTIVGILTFLSLIDTASERLIARNFFICRYFSFYEQLKFRAQLN